MPIAYYCLLPIIAHCLLLRSADCLSPIAIAIAIAQCLLSIAHACRVPIGACDPMLVQSDGARSDGVPDSRVSCMSCMPSKINKYLHIDNPRHVDVLRILGPRPSSPASPRDRRWWCSPTATPAHSPPPGGYAPTNTTPHTPHPISPSFPCKDPPRPHIYVHHPSTHNPRPSSPPLEAVLLCCSAAMLPCCCTLVCYCCYCCHLMVLRLVLFWC